ncbi:MAG: LysR family transcriptional regulator [Kordiimonas sp.]
MINELRAMAIFAETIKQGSFKKASVTLGLSPSVVSYHVGQLEERVGNALIYRSTRKLSLTSEGKLLFEHAEAMLAAAGQGLDLVSSKRETPVGALCLTVPTSLTRGPLAAALAVFRAEYPDIQLSIIYTDQRQDLIEGGIDLAIRVGAMEDSSLMSRQLGVIERKLVCSPSYMANRVTPMKPSDLESLDWIRHSMLPTVRTLIKGAERVQVNFTSGIAVNSVDAMAQLSKQGVGLSTPPTPFVADMLESSELIEVLPGWCVESIPVYAVWPNNVSSASNTRLLLDHLLSF